MSNTHTTVDLIVRHAERHIAEITPRTPSANAIGIALFSLAGMIVIATAFAIIQMATHVPGSAIFAKDSKDYAAQHAFYTGQQVVVAPTAVETAHAAAMPNQFGMTLFTMLALAIGAFLALALYKQMFGEMTFATEAPVARKPEVVTETREFTRLVVLQRGARPRVQKAHATESISVAKTEKIEKPVFQVRRIK